MKDTDAEKFSESKKYLVGGVNSPFRTFDLVGGIPIFIKKGKGSKIISEDNNEYIDYSLAWGAIILGHSNKKIRNAIKKTSKTGWIFGTPTEVETLFAKKIKAIFPSMEKIRLTNSGTEGVMGALKVARSYTKKDKIIILEGSYHGHSNDTLVKIMNEEKILASSGIPNNILENTFIGQYNDISSIEKLFNQHSDIAAVILEPIPGNMGVVLPKNDFLQNLRELCNKNNSLLIFDEVISGLHASLGGAQELFNVKPDITVLGKAIAGGLPIGVFGGKNEIMDYLSPVGTAYVAGTFSGNAMTVNCGIATLDEISKNYAELNHASKVFCEELISFINKNNIPAVVNYTGSMFSIFFTQDKEISTFEDVSKCDFAIFSKFFHYLLKNGICISPSGEDTIFISTAHTKSDLQKTSKIIEEFLITLKK